MCVPEYVSWTFTVLRYIYTASFYFYYVYLQYMSSYDDDIAASQDEDSRSLTPTLGKREKKDLTLEWNNIG